MCHSGFPFESKNGGWLVFQAARVIVVQRATGHASTAVTGEAAGGTCGEGGPKRCLCSPSQHPGSFRCRQHHANYVWRGSAGGSARKRAI
ncbi:hypothetical protein L6164_007979 [Bauhinia variegata]|uniref:Uncharacterized protein n=1 Tax=Bauhinia variegata TaxID=167791 RepID=A0ACB9PFD9_BAUVA|nr:hypothetical protein L6164_007979 [Bauhinia variegata]